MLCAHWGENIIRPEALHFLHGRDAPITTWETPGQNWALVSYSFHTFWKLKPKSHVWWKTKKALWWDGRLCHAIPNCTLLTKQSKSCQMLKSKKHSLRWQWLIGIDASLCTCVTSLRLDNQCCLVLHRMNAWTKFTPTKADNMPLIEQYNTQQALPWPDLLYPPCV